MGDDFLWTFLVVGYVLTVAVEAPILLVGLSRRHPIRHRLFAGFWLSACTYPVVVLVLPPLFPPGQRWLYLLVAETFAPVAECVLFLIAFGGTEPRSRRATLRDCAVIVAANLASFGAG